jgi:hypothetical protein
MSDQIDPEDGKRQILPFSDDWLDEVKRLREEVVAVRDKLSPFFMDPVDPSEAALERKVTEQVARYGLPENDRHATIRQAAATVNNQLRGYAASRETMGSNYISAAPMITMKLDGVVLTGIKNILDEFNNEMRDLTARLAGMSEGDIPEEVQAFIQSQGDSSKQVLIGQYALVCGLAGRLIDAGNEFLNLNARRSAALELYANGKAPKGWSQHLPTPARSIFSEATWTIIEECVRAAAEHGPGAIVPFGGLLVLPARIYFVIREERAREQGEFRRDDVDELLNLADQLTAASDGANLLLDGIAVIVQDASAAH